MQHRTPIALVSSHLRTSLVTAVTTFLALSGAVMACSGAPAESEAAGLAAEDQPFSTGLSGEPVHEDVTAEGLAFLRPEVIAAVQAANVSVDIELGLVSSHHFDDCNFAGGADVIRGYQEAAVAAMGVGDVTAVAAARAMTAFGQWLHTVQDFYAHSNWVELGGQTLADASLVAWADWSPYETLATSGFRLVQGTAPARTSVTRDEDAPYPASAVVRVKTGKQQWPGVISGSVDYEPGEYCPPAVRMSHDDLNKDHGTTAGRTAQFAAARGLAVQQTRHEWCRLVAMTRAAWGEAGEARLAAWMVDPAAAVCP